MDAVFRKKKSNRKNLEDTTNDHGRNGGFLGRASWLLICTSLGLSSREADVCSLALDDLSEDQIARELGISAHTVHTHFERVYRKLGVRSRCQLIVSLFRAYSRLPAAPSGC
jgi:DNA-binding CsgD family transcriptional regulator